MPKNTLITFIAAGCLVAFTGLCAVAQDNQQDQDKKFVTAASEGGLAEVDFGKLAAQKAKNPDVRAFAQKMVQDHTTLNNKMAPVAQELGVTPAQHLGVENVAEYAKLKVLTGDEFDKSYVSEMVKDHHADLAAFQQEEQVAANPALKRTVTAGARVIAMHTHMADHLAQELGVQISMNK
jgi:putative membrane protein